MRDPFSILCHSNALSFTDLLSLWSDDDSDYVEIVMLYAVCCMHKVDLYARSN